MPIGPREVLSSDAARSHQESLALSRAKPVDVVDVGRFFDTVRRHWRRIAIGGAIGGALAFMYVRAAVPRFEATATVRIDAKPNTLPTIYAEQSARDEVFTEIEVLRSHTIAADVVDSLSLQLDMVQPRRAARSAVFKALRLTTAGDSGSVRLIRRRDGRYTVDDGSGTIVVPGTPATVHGVSFVLARADRSQGIVELRIRPREQTITELRRDVDIGRAGLQANIIALRYESEDAALARDVLNAWTSSFIRRRQSIQRVEATNTAAFIQAQLDTLMPQLSRAEDRLLAYRNAQRIVAPDVEASAQVNQRALLQASRDDLEGERRALQQAMSRVRIQAAAASSDAPSPYRELIGFPTLLKNQAASELLRSLASLDDQRTTLLMRRTTEDPDVITLSQQIRVVENQLQAITSTYLRGVTAQVQSSDNSLARYSTSMRAIPAQEVEYARLQRAPRVYEELVRLLQTRLKEAQITEAVTDASVRVVDEAVIPARPSSPNVPLLLVMGLMGGVVAGASLALVREHRLAAVRSRRDLQLLSDAPVLGLIPSFAPNARRIARERSATASVTGGDSMPARSLVAQRSTRTSDLAAAEAFVRLYMNVQWTAGQPLRSMLVTSPLPGDGKTTSVLYLAAAAASQDKRVLLVDADLRCGGLTRALGVRERRGFVDVLTGGATIGDCIASVTLPGGMRADAIGAGSLSRDAGVPQIVAGIQALVRDTEGYDLILIDTPPINIVADAAALAPLTDGVLLVTRAGETSAAAVDVALDQLRRAGAHVLGTVLNGAEFHRSEGYGTLEQYHAYTMARA